MDRKPIFEIPFHQKTFMDTQNHILPTINGNPEFRRGTKGFGLAGFGANDGLGYTKTIPNGTYSVVMWSRIPSQLSKFLLDFREGGGTGYFWVDAGGVLAASSGTIYVDNIATTSFNNSVQCLVLSGITLEATEIFVNIRSLTYASAMVNGNIPYLTIYSGTFTAAERDELYQNFLDSPGPTSTPAVIRHKIPVDPAGSVLTHDYQNWRGGIVPDLSGNLNDGTPNGFVDCGMGGARFDGVDSYIDCGNPVEINAIGTGDFTITTLIEPFTATGIFRAILTKRQWGDWGIDLKQGHTLRFHYSGVGLESFTGLGDNQWHLLGVVRRGNLLYFFNNGVTWGSSFDVTALNLSNAHNLYIGSRWSAPHTNIFKGNDKFLQILPYALTEAKIQANWNEIANQAIFNEPMFNQLPDSRSYTAGMYLENWYVSSGTFTVKEDSVGTYIECTGNGVIQYKGIDFSMYKENGFIKKIVGDISSDQGVTVDTAVNIAFASNVLSVTLTTGQKLYELVITKGEEV